jgi:hypothetical protein
MMVIENKFEIGAIVYLKTDKDQDARMVTEIIVGENYVGYTLTVGMSASTHSAIELSTVKDILIQI